VIRRVIEHLEPGGDRLVGLVQALLLDLGDPAEQRDGVDRLGVDHAAQDVDQLAPLLAGEVQPLERVQRGGVVRVIVQHVAPRRDRGVALAELILLECGDAREQRAALGAVLGPLGLLAHHVAQLGPRATLFVQPRERGGRATCGRGRCEIGLEQAFVRRDRARRIAELRVVVRRELAE